MQPIDIHFDAVTTQDLLLLKKMCDRCGYTIKAFLKYGINPYIRTPLELPIHALRISQMKSFESFFRLFFLGDSLCTSAVLRFMSSDAIKHLNDLKILSISGTSVLSNILLLPYQKYIFASDFMLRYNQDEVVRQEHTALPLVYPPGTDSVLLAHSLISRINAKVLDIGTGCGFLAILASKSSQQVVGVDINRRAIQFAQFNGRLNQIKNIKFKSGDLFQPVKGEKFDLILSNPAYEIATPGGALYRDGGSKGVMMLKKMLSQLSKFLESEGICQVVCRVAEYSHHTVETLVAQWLANSNFKVIFLEANSEIPLHYAFVQSLTALPEFSRYITFLKFYFASLPKRKIMFFRFGVLTLVKSKRYSFQTIRLNKQHSDSPINPKIALETYVKKRNKI